MDIHKFLEQTEGDWFSQRTIYNLTEKEAPVNNGKANLTIEILPSENPEIAEISQKYSLDSSLILGAIASNWDNSPDWGKPKEIGASKVILVKNDEKGQTGKIFRIINKPTKKIISGDYILGEDEALTLILEENNHYFEERIWFASPNLRLRTTLSKNNTKYNSTSFYSEIKKVKS